VDLILSLMIESKGNNLGRSGGEHLREIRV